MSEHVSIPASSNPDDLTVGEWQSLDFAMGQVSAAVHHSVMTLARRVRSDSRREVLSAVEGACARLEDHARLLLREGDPAGAGLVQGSAFVVREAITETKR